MEWVKRACSDVYHHILPTPTPSTPEVGQPTHIAAWPWLGGFESGRSADAAPRFPCCKRSVNGLAQKVLWPPVLKSLCIIATTSSNPPRSSAFDANPVPNPLNHLQYRPSV